MKNKLITITQWAAKQRPTISTRRATALALQKRIPGAVRFGNQWAIPADAKVTPAKGRWG